MRKKIAVTVVSAAIAALALPVGPARATHLCQIWAPPFDRVPCTVLAVICSPPLPPTTICR